MKELRLLGTRAVRRAFVVTVAAAGGLALALSASAAPPSPHVTSGAFLSSTCAFSGQTGGGGTITYSWFDYHSANEADITIYENNGTGVTFAAVVASGKFPSSGSFQKSFSMTNGADYSYSAVLRDRKGNPIDGTAIPKTDIGVANCT